MTKNERAVLDLLKEDSRYSAKVIASMLELDAATVTGIIEKLEKSGVIVKYTTISNSEKEEAEVVEAMIEVRVSPTGKSGFDSIAELISQHDEVKSLYLMSGSYDLAIFIEGKNLREVAMFVSEKLSGIGNIISTATHFILKKYKLSGVTVSSDPTCRQSVHP